MKTDLILGLIAREIAPTADGAAPEWVVLWKAGPGALKTGEKFLVDQKAYEMVARQFTRGGTDVVWDYEHQTIFGDKAPAAGWIKELKWDPEAGILARVEWTEAAAQMIEKREYRYHSPVFGIRASDNRVVFLHSVALTNTPKTVDAVPIAAKNMIVNPEKEDSEMNEFVKKLLAKLKDMEGKGTTVVTPIAAKLETLGEDVTDDVLADAMIAAFGEIQPDEKKIIAKDVIEALGMDEENPDTSTVVANIHALKRGKENMVTREELNSVKAQLAERDAKEAVDAALHAGKITPDQTEWATDYARKDLKGFNIYVSKAPQVVPVKDLPGKKQHADEIETSPDTLAVAKFFGNSAEDLKKYGGIQ
ncbi:MAG: phage protease [Desulfobacterales bacterium]|nr:phage protease [Desulfobacterales bacterium]